MYRLIHPFIVLFMAAGLFLSMNSPAPAMQTLDNGRVVLSFGIIPTDSMKELKKSFEPFIASLAKKMGDTYSIETKYATDYAGIIEGMRFDNVDFAWFGNKAALEASNRADGEVFAQTTSSDGAPGYWSHFIVHKDSPYKNIDDIIANAEELVFSNGDPNSTSGYLVPSYYIWGQRGIIPEQLFQEVRNASHGANCMAVAQKQVDVATNNNQSLEVFRESHPELGSQIKVIWKSPLIPNDPFVWRKDLPREVKAALKGAVLSFGRFGPNAEREKEILTNMQDGFGTFLNSDNKQLLPIRQLNLAREKMEVEANKDLSSSQKSQLIEKINAQLKELQEYAKMVQKY